MISRRKLVGAMGAVAGVAVVRPQELRAQQPSEPIRRIGVMLGIAENDPEAQARIAALREGLKDLGWVEGRNLRIDAVWLTGRDARTRATDVLSFAPDVIVTSSTEAMPFFRQQTSGIPIVFVQVPDPVRAGFVASLARPGGNITGFTSYEHTIGGKWLGLLKEAAPSVTRAAVLINSQVAAWFDVFRTMETLSPSLGVRLTAAPVRDAGEVDAAVAAAATEPNSGLIVLPGQQTARNRDSIIGLSARHRLPTVYPYRYYVASGGVMSYGIDSVHLLRQAASYVDRILRGAKPGELPVQQPTKFELVLNLKAAKSLGMEFPATLLARADEVIE